MDKLADLTRRLEACSIEWAEHLPVGYGPPINPDGPEAAQAIASLTEAVRVLTEALEALQLQALQSELNNPAHEWGWEALQKTRAALTTAKELTK